MAMINKLKQLVESRGDSLYQFQKDSGLSKTTVYDLANNPYQFPKGKVFDAIYQVYPDVSLDEIVEHVPNEAA